jgi:hypothetical protein
MSDPQALSETIKHLSEDMEVEGYTVRDVCVSPVLGGRGAIEFLIYIDNQAPALLSPAAVAQRALLSLHSAPPVRPEDLDVIGEP